MPTVLLIAVTAIYLWVAILFAIRGDGALALVYFGYAAANFGLMAVAQ